MIEPYQVLYVDPPWRYDNKNTGGSMVSGSAAHYPVLGMQELLDFPIEGLRAPDSVCFMWVTNPMMAEGHELLAAWGYKYKTMITWVKLGRIGMGFWFRGNTEHCLLGVRGKIKPFRSSIRNHFEVRPTKHSKKPLEMIAMIEDTCYDLNPKLEMFSTECLPGWDAWGNEVPCSVQVDKHTKQWAYCTP